MNWLDIVILIMLVISLFIGLKAGLIEMGISLAGLILGMFLAGNYYQMLANRLTFISSGKAAQIVAYIAILIVVMIVAAIVAWILSKIVSALMLGWLNHLGGAIVGLIMASIFIGAILAIWAKYGNGGDIISNS